MKTLTVELNYSDMRLDRYVSKVTVLSKGDIQKNIRKKNIKLNGKKAAASDRVHEGDRVVFYIPDSCFREEMKERKREELGLIILYENERIIKEQLEYEP